MFGGWLENFKVEGLFTEIYVWGRDKNADTADDLERDGTLKESYGKVET